MFQANNNSTNSVINTPWYILFFTVYCVYILLSPFNIIVFNPMHFILLSISDSLKLVDTDRLTDQPTDQLTDIFSHRAAIAAKNRQVFCHENISLVPDHVTQHPIFVCSSISDILWGAIITNITNLYVVVWAFKTTVGFPFLFYGMFFIGWHEPFKATWGKDQRGCANGETFISSVIIYL